MTEKKEFVEPVVMKYEEKLSQVTRGNAHMGSPPEDLEFPEDA